jgi:O-antigen ligase
MNFGLSEFVPYLLYAAGVLALILSIFWRPVVGIFYLIPLIPLQTVRYWMNGFPMGQSVVDIIIAGVIIGSLRRRQAFMARTPLNGILLIYAVYTFGSLCWGSMFLGRPLSFFPPDDRLADWKSYMTMPLLLVLIAATIENTKQIRIVILLMCIAVFMLDRSFWATVSTRDFSHFSEDLREEGGMGYAGANGLAAFEAQFATVLLALAAFDARWWKWLGYSALAAFCGICLTYSLSRGGYIAVVAGWLFIGLVWQRKLLVAFIVLLALGTSVLPVAVVQRMTMTYDKERGGLDNSAEIRLQLWNDALDVVQSKPLTGTGFNTYAYMGRVGSYRDTHNIYLKVLVETGVLGLLLFLALLWKLFALGWRTFRTAEDPLFRSLGLAVAGWIVCAAVANLFGDRWTYLQVDGYLWVLGGLVWRGVLIERAIQAESASYVDEAGGFEAHLASAG